MAVSFEEDHLGTPSSAAGASPTASFLIKTGLVRSAKEADTLLLIFSGIGIIISASLFVMFTTSIQQEPIDVVAQQQQDGFVQR